MSEQSRVLLDQLESLASSGPLPEYQVRQVVLLAARLTQRPLGPSEDSYFWVPRPNIEHAFDEFLAIYQSVGTIKDPAIRLERSREAGYAYETVAALVVNALIGWSRFRSYQSNTFQHDILVYGESSEWQFVRNRLGMLPDLSRILFEVKAQRDKIDVKTFGRLCAAIQEMHGVGLGVFITCSGAKDFPKPGVDAYTRKGVALLQAMFYARTRTPVVVFDLDEIEQCAKGRNNFLSVLRTKIDALIDLGREHLTHEADRQWVQAPPHILSVLQGSGRAEDSADPALDEDSIKRR